MAMSDKRFPKVLIGMAASVVVAVSGLGAFFEAYQGGPGTIAFVVRLCLVATAFLGAFIVVLALRTPRNGDQ
jgi:hypothetical protein